MPGVYLYFNPELQGATALRRESNPAYIKSTGIITIYGINY